MPTVAEKLVKVKTLSNVSVPDPDKADGWKKVVPAGETIEVTQRDADGLIACGAAEKP